MTKTEAKLSIKDLELLSKIKKNAQTQLIIGAPILLLFLSGITMPYFINCDVSDKIILFFIVKLYQVNTIYNIYN